MDMAWAALALEDFEGAFDLGGGVGGLDLSRRGQGEECREESTRREVKEKRAKKGCNR
jgi:hypothetical protein